MDSLQQEKLKQIVNELYEVIDKAYVHIVPLLSHIEVDLKIDHYRDQFLSVYSSENLWDVVFYVRSLPMTTQELQCIIRIYHDIRDILEVVIERMIRRWISKVGGTMFEGFFHPNPRSRWLIAVYILEAFLITLANPVRGLLNEHEVIRGVVKILLGELNHVKRDNT